MPTVSSGPLGEYTAFHGCSRFPQGFPNAAAAAAQMSALHRFDRDRTAFLLSCKAASVARGCEMRNRHHYCGRGKAFVGTADRAEG